MDPTGNPFSPDWPRGGRSDSAVTEAANASSPWACIGWVSGLSSSAATASWLRPGVA